MFAERQAQHSMQAGGMEQRLGLARPVVNLQAGIAPVGQPLRHGAVPPRVPRPGASMHQQHQRQLRLAVPCLHA